MGFVAWAPKRGAIWAGWIPGDGQLVSRATFPDLAAAVADGAVPVVSEAEWLADPLKRGLHAWRWDHQYSRAGLQRQVRRRDWRGLSPGMARCPWRMARSRLARTRLMVTRFNLPSICMWKRMAPSWGSSTSTPVFLRYTSVEGGRKRIRASFPVASSSRLSAPCRAPAASMPRNWPAGSPFLRRRSRPISTSSCSIPAVRRRLPDHLSEHRTDDR